MTDETDALLSAADAVFQLDDLYDLADFEIALATEVIKFRAPATVQPQNDAPGNFVINTGARIKGISR